MLFAKSIQLFNTKATEWIHGVKFCIVMKDIHFTQFCDLKKILIFYNIPFEIFEREYWYFIVDNELRVLWHFLQVLNLVA
jgi:hypothetical protein